MSKKPRLNVEQCLEALELLKLEFPKMVHYYNKGKSQVVPEAPSCCVEIILYQSLEMCLGRIGRK